MTATWTPIANDIRTVHGRGGAAAVGEEDEPDRDALLMVWSSALEMMQTSRRTAAIPPGWRPLGLESGGISRHGGINHRLPAGKPPACLSAPASPRCEVYTPVLLLITHSPDHAAEALVAGMPGKPLQSSRMQRVSGMHEAGVLPAIEDAVFSTVEIDGTRYLKLQVPKGSIEFIVRSGP